MLKKSITQGKFKRLFEEVKFDDIHSIFLQKEMKSIVYFLHVSKNGHWIYYQVTNYSNPEGFPEGFMTGESYYFKVKVETIL